MTLKSYFLQGALLSGCCIYFGLARAQQFLDYVQPLSGTAAATTPAALKHSEAGSEKNANTIPAVTLPFAMTQWTPETRLTENKCVPPYYYRDSFLTGFRATHWLSGSCTQDYGSFSLMPVAGQLKTDPALYAAAFSHQQETARPDYYRVKTADWVAEMTASPRCGMLQLRLEQDDSLYLLIRPNSDEAKGFIQIDEKTGTVWGYNPVHRIYQGWGESAGFSGWFYIEFDRPSSQCGSFSAAGISGKPVRRDEKGLGAYIGWSLKKGQRLQVRIGTSFSSLAAARNNLSAEIHHQPFEAVRQAAARAWEQALGQVEVVTGDQQQKRIFYTALYHAMQQPRLFSDVDGSYPAFNSKGRLLRMSRGHYYDDFSMWDIYRAQLPLFEILSPDLINEWIRSLIAKAASGGWLPVFPCWNSYTAAMIGDHATAFIAGAYQKGIRDYDIQKAYYYMRKNAFDRPDNADYKNGLGRRALISYSKYGFIPMEDTVPEAFHHREQVSRTLEYAFDDYALALTARSLGRTDDYQRLRGRAFNYRKVFDTAVGLVRGRYRNGSWYEPFRPDQREPYITEGTPRQYTFYVPHDIPGLAGLMGGTNALEKALDSLFDKGEYWHGNEPGHQIPFLYNYTAAPYKTQQQVSRILKEEYSDGPGGLSGNDDAGQMSAWYVFASLGFYPVDPVSGHYLLTVPIFDSVILQIPGKKKFEIIRHGNGSGDYIQSVRWNGRPYLPNYISYRMIMGGGRLEFVLADQPTDWGKDPAARPPGLQTKVPQ
ncbi:GH92 family glycosyl hydrolase [Niabella terrae]